MHSNRRWTGSGGESWNCSDDEQAQHWNSFALLTIYLRNCESQSGAAPICSRKRVRNGDDSVVVLLLLFISAHRESGDCSTSMLKQCSVKQWIHCKTKYYDRDLNRYSVSTGSS